MLVTVAVFCGVVAAAALCATQPSWLTVSALAFADVAWVLVNGPVEGYVLLQFTEDHGLTVADLLVPATLPILIARLVHRRDGR